MGFELDTLKNNDTCVCLNRVTGVVFSFYSVDDLVKKIKKQTDKPIQELFEYDEIRDFIDWNINYNDYEEVQALNKIYGVKNE